MDSTSDMGLLIYFIFLILIFIIIQYNSLRFYIFDIR
jgi:hypothetical protein